ncbi:MAG: hypothetical protein HOI95_04635, partial [Chromatiales bacterium]|nr:hypothetical protein [Chromatiales bacterium]
ERVGVPGWQCGRRYEAVDAHPRFFTYYETDSPDACFSDAYLARLNAPTPQTVEVMRHWSAMTRTVCEQVARRGRMVGAYVVVARFEQMSDEAGTRLDGVFEALCEPTPPINIRLWRASGHPRTVNTVEGGMRRSADGTIKAALVVDFMREAAALTFLPRLRDALQAAGLVAAGVGCYRFLGEYR